MRHNRIEALKKIINDLEAFRLDPQPYFYNPELQEFYDAVLRGKINSLRAFCQTLGWSELMTKLQELTPLQGNGIESLELIQTYIVPEARRLLANTDIEGTPRPTDWFWQFVHPGVAALARPLCDAGFYGEAVEAVYKEFNEAVKRLVIDASGCELDGAKLMNKAFSIEKPLIKLTPLKTVSDKDTQKGYMQIMSGAMTGIRNPKAHGNLKPDANKALHLICLASLLMYKIDERVDEGTAR